MAEPELDATAPAPPRWLHDADQVEQKHGEAVAVAVEACADDIRAALKGMEEDDSEEYDDDSEEDEGPIAAAKAANSRFVDYGVLSSSDDEASAAGPYFSLDGREVLEYPGY